MRKQKPLNSLVPYFGAKRLQAKSIIELIGDHNAYWEPFAGSMAVLLAKPKSSVEVVNDLNEWLINLATVVQNDSLAERLFDRLERTLFCESLYHDASTWLQYREAELHGPFDNQHPKLVCRSLELDFEAAYNYFVVSWMGRNGLSGTDREFDTGFCKRFTSNGGDPAVRFRNAGRSIPFWWERLQGVTILKEDGIVLIERIEDKEGTVIYIDSPYVSKSAKYRYDFSETDHRRLAMAASRFKKTKVVVSYYEDELIRTLYPVEHWNWFDASTKKQMGNGKVDAPEVLIVNGRG